MCNTGNLTVKNKDLIKVLEIQTWLIKGDQTALPG